MAEQEQQYKLVKKMSSKTVFGSRLDILQLCLTDRAKPHALFDVIGIARGMRFGETSQGPWQAFIGEFQAQSYNPLFANIVFSSGRLFLGGPAGDLLAGQMNIHDDNHVEFAFSIQAQADDASATGYTYTAVPLVKPQGGSAIDKLRARLTGGKFQLLAAPSGNVSALQGPASAPATSPTSNTPRDGTPKRA